MCADELNVQAATLSGTHPMAGIAYTALWGPGRDGDNLLVGKKLCKRSTGPSPGRLTKSHLFWFLINPHAVPEESRVAAGFWQLSSPH